MSRPVRRRACRHGPLLTSLVLIVAATLPSVAVEAQSAPASLQVAAEQVSLSGIGDPRLRPLIEAWLADYERRSPAHAAVLGRWNFRTDLLAIGALMDERADMAAMLRPFDRTELAPYAHAWHGDMMEHPLMIAVARFGDLPVRIAVNRRPGAPLPPKTSAFLDYVLSDAGQAVAARVPGFAALPPDKRAGERAKYHYYIAPLDPALPDYVPIPGLHDEISSDGSDGMKALVDRWEREFHGLQPGVTRGELWEHLGTLNGFHAMLAGDADLAPMGRELWPDEAAAYKAVFGQDAAPIEIRVAKGGFNTPQRTTAQAVFVAPGNPLKSLTMQQLAGIFGAHPTITRWGQLGLVGAWKNRPIEIFVPPLIAPNAMSFQQMVLHGGAWNAHMTQAPLEVTAASIAGHPGAIGFGGFEEGPGLPALAIAPDSHSAPVAGSGASVSSGRYPLVRYMYIRLNPSALRPATIAFLRYVLSRRGQDDVRWSAYFPLSAAEAKAELAKLPAG